MVEILRGEEPEEPVILLQQVLHKEILVDLHPLEAPVEVEAVELVELVFPHHLLQVQLVELDQAHGQEIVH